MSDPQFNTRALQILDRYEGEKLYAYPDSRGYLTIGKGRCIDRRVGGGISAEESLYLAQNDVANLDLELQKYAWYSKQDPVRRLALWELRYELGADGLLHWPHFLGYMDLEQYSAAANEIRTNKVYLAEVHDTRAESIAVMIETGNWAPP